MSSDTAGLERMILVPIGRQARLAPSHRAPSALGRTTLIGSSGQVSGGKKSASRRGCNTIVTPRPRTDLATDKAPAIGPETSLVSLLVDEAESLNRLYNIVRHAGCDIRLYDSERDLICHYGRMVAGEPTDQQQIATVGDAGHDDQTTPIFSPEGVVVGYLEARPENCPLAVAALPMTRAVVKSVARAIEERMFRKRYRRDWIIGLLRWIAVNASSAPISILGPPWRQPACT